MMREIMRKYFGFTLVIVFILLMVSLGYSQTDEKLKVYLIMSKYDVIKVQIADGRSKSGEKAAIITLKDTSPKGDIGKVGGVLIACGIYHSGKFDNFDSVAIAVGGTDSKVRCVITCKMKHITAYNSKRISINQFMEKWTVAMRAKGYADKQARMFGWD